MASGRITIVEGTGNGSSIYLIQALRPDAFRERRLKITGFIRTQDLVGGAALIFNVEGPNGQRLGRDPCVEES